MLKGLIVAWSGARCVELNATLTMTRPTGRVSRELTSVKKHECISVTGVLVGLQEFGYPCQHFKKFEVHGFHGGKMVSLVLQVKILHLCFEFWPLGKRTARVIKTTWQKKVAGSGQKQEKHTERCLVQGTTFLDLRRERNQRHFTPLECVLDWSWGDRNPPNPDPLTNDDNLTNSCCLRRRPQPLRCSHFNCETELWNLGHLVNLQQAAPDAATAAVLSALGGVFTWKQWDENGTEASSQNSVTHRSA